CTDGHKEGEIWRPEACRTCRCQDGKVFCQAEDCTPAPCQHPAIPQGKCCPECGDCLYQGRHLSNRQDYWKGPCTHCICQAGTVQCQVAECPELSCRERYIPPGECCPVCLPGCEYEEQRYHDGDVFVAASNPCINCSCLRSLVQCHPIQCPPLRCSKAVPQPGHCCPVCPACELEGRRLEPGQKVTTADGCQRCSCVEGELVCTLAQLCPVSCTHGLPPALGSCCPDCSRCLFHGQVLLSGGEGPGSHQCERCTCKGGNIICARVSCPKLDCAKREDVADQCCPRCQAKARGHPTGRFCGSSGWGGKAVPEPSQIALPRPPGRPSSYPGRICPGGFCSLQHCNPLAGTGRNAAPKYTKCVWVGKAGLCIQEEEASTFALIFEKKKREEFLIQTFSLQRRALPAATSPPHTHTLVFPFPPCAGCNYAGKEYPNRAEFPHPTDKCRQCHCINGNVQCLTRRCPPLLCPEPFVTPGQCCPQCPAPPAGCLYLGLSYQHTERFYDPSDKCRDCICSNATVTCQRQPCAPVRCSHPLQQDCCRTCDGCSYHGVTVSNGQTFPDPGDALCSQCTCQAGSVQCLKKLCAPALCAHPVSGPCACPLCQGCIFQGHEYKDNESFPSPNKPCEQCHCLHGNVSCAPRPCPTPPCPHPSRDPCGCPTCDACSFHGRESREGERFPDPREACMQCQCLNGTVTCSPAPCPPATCKNPVTPPGQCCPKCTGACRYHGHLYKSGEAFTPPQDPCRACTCLAEVVTCQPKPCPVRCTHPLPPTAPACCPSCEEGCLYGGQHYANRQAFTPPANPCRHCTCLRGNVLCTAVVCPRALCASPSRKPGQCCPQCPECRHAGQEYPEGSQWLSPLDPCQQCSCVQGESVCDPLPCETTLCSHPAPGPGRCCPLCHDCLFEGERYAHGQAFKPESCLQCSCQPCQRDGGGGGCTYEGRDRPDGSRWLSSSTPCMACMCADGVATCAEIVCISSCINQIEVPGECCPLCAECTYEGRVYGPGETFQPGQDPCEICTCELMSDGEQHLQCYRKQCPSLLDCPRDQILPPGAGHCCPTCAEALSNCTSSLVGNEIHATDEPCYSCQCKDLTWVCVHRGCPPLSCPPAERFTPHGACCPICDECVIEVEGRRVSDGETWKDSTDNCVSCSCSLGHIECHIQECQPVVCQGGEVKVQPPGQCCAECQAPVSSCSYQGQNFGSNEHWQVDACTACTCLSGEVHCRTERCPTAACAADEMPTVIPGMCCPHCVPRPATCVVFGDPHYRTFDGRMVHFQGSCTYVLSQDCKGSDFSIHVTNDDRGRPGVSWTKEVTVQVGDSTVRLLQDRVVMVDSQTVTLPFLKEPRLYIELKATTLLLNTDIGLKVLWNGRSHLEVSVPGNYKGQTCGLCGNFNSYPQDDLRLRSGQLTLSEAAFGNSWKVVAANGTESGRCADGTDVDPCKESGYRSRKEANARCKVLKLAPFERCHAAVPPEPFFASCVYDLCACGASSSEDCLCEALEAYAAECRHAGLVLQWRSPMLCAVGCPQDRGYVFDECGPPCPKTCFNHAVPLGVLESHCFKPCVPGCQCPAGLVEHDAHCILPESCPRIIYGSL
ncbi:hypothetical protein JRQ81_015477, partial [Phrynocephalus forsythii]